MIAVSHDARFVILLLRNIMNEWLTSGIGVPILYIQSPKYKASPDLNRMKIDDDLHVRVEMVVGTMISVYPVNLTSQCAGGVTVLLGFDSILIVFTTVILLGIVSIFLQSIPPRKSFIGANQTLGRRCIAFK